MTTFISSISKNEFPESKKVHAKTIRKSIFDLIDKDHEKLDHLIIHQQQELLNIQQVQVEIDEGHHETVEK